MGKRKTNHKLKLIIGLVAFMLISASAQWLHAEADLTRVTNNSYEDTLPVIEGTLVVWQAYVDGDWEIFLYNMDTQATTQITDNDENDLSPQTDGQYVVWQGLENGQWDIFLWDGVQVQAISDSSSQDVSPKIADGLVVWTAEPFGDDYLSPGEIMLYDIDGRTSHLLSGAVDPGNAFDDSAPSIDEEAVTWLQNNDDDGVNIMVYDLGSEEITAYPPTYIPGADPQVDGNLTILTSHDGADREIYLFNSAPRHYHQITDNSLEDECPSLSGNRMAWSADGEIYVADYRYLGLVTPKDNANVPDAPDFTWEGIGYNAFKVQFSADANFPFWRTVTYPRGSNRYLTQAAYTPSRGMWFFLTMMARRSDRIYWRVLGEDAEGAVAYSDAQNFTTGKPVRLRRTRR